MSFRSPHPERHVCTATYASLCRTVTPISTLGERWKRLDEHILQTGESL